MNRLARTFETLRTNGRKGLIGYLTAGDPDLAESEKRLRMALDGGVDVLELGVPFSDPTADGPVIQAAAHRALATGTTLPKVLELVSRLRRDYAQPIVLFGYANPFFGYGFEKLARDADEVGVDGVLVVDIPFEEQREIVGPLHARGLAYIPLVAPTTSPERMATILEGASGFVYAITVRGVTGQRSDLVLDMAGQVRAIRACSDLPVAVGFGIGNARQAEQAASCADAVVVGSALIEAAQAGHLADKVRELRSALDNTRTASR